MENGLHFVCLVIDSIWHIFAYTVDLGEGVTRVKMTRMRKRTAERLKESQNTAAMLTTFNEIDMSNIIAFRNKHKDEFFKKHGIKV